jgi:hypothetical protein
MRELKSLILLNAFGIIWSTKVPETPDNVPKKGEDVKEWTQYTEGDRADWMKYMNKPGSTGQGSDGQFDWMQYAGPYMSQYTNPHNNASSAASANGNTSWNNGQGDGFGEPFRSQTGGDFRYKIGREWNKTDDGWQKFAAPYSGVNPQQPGGNGTDMDWQKYMGGSQGQGGQMDWKEYMGGGKQGGDGGQIDWKKYMGGGGQSGSGGQMDWQQYAKPYMGGGSSNENSPQPQAGGYFELEVSGKDLNVTTNFGLGQGHGGNTSNTTTGGGGGGGGNQNAITAKEGRIFIRGQFLNQLMGKDVVPA